MQEMNYYNRCEVIPLKRFLVIGLPIILLLFFPINIHAEVCGVTNPNFSQAVKQKKIVLKKSRVGKTTLYFDSKVSSKKVKLIKKWIKQMPTKVQRCAKKIYLMRRRYYDLTAKGAHNTYAYFVFKSKEIYIWNNKDTNEMRHTIFHEFGHAYDCRKKHLEHSSKDQWEKILRTNYCDYENKHEKFADLFADYFEFLLEDENVFITNALKK